MPTDSPLPLRWPDRLAKTAATLAATAPSGRDAARAELWKVLHAALFASLRAQAHRVPAASREDLEDLASSKSLEILARTEEGAWTPAGRAAHEIAGFVARVARNGLIDLARRRGREVAPPDDEEAWRDRLGVTPSANEPAPDDQAAASEFVAALVECVAGLSSRAREVWFQRVFLEASSRDIAARCEVRPAHVDVLVQRARLALRTCMRQKGHEGAEARPGVFASLWPIWMQSNGTTRSMEDARPDA